MEKQNINLKSTVAEKEKDMVRLMGAVQEVEKKRHNGLLHREDMGRKNRKVGLKKRSRGLKSLQQRSHTSSLEEQAAGQSVIPRSFQSSSNASTVSSAPAYYEAMCSTVPKDQDYTLSNFLHSITTLSRRVEETDLQIVGPEQIERSLDAFQEEIQRCIENWSIGEVPHEEILWLMERVLEEWEKERSTRMRFERDVSTMMKQQPGPFH